MQTPHHDLMRTLGVYVLAFGVAHLGGLVGILSAAATMRRLRPATPFVPMYALDIAPGLIGHAQRAVISFARVAAAFLSARAVLSFFGLRLAVWFAGLIAVSLLAWDLWGLHVAGREREPVAASSEHAVAVRATARVAIPLGICAAVVAAWLVVRQ
jgi:hypothetical protein